MPIVAREPGPDRGTVSRSGNLEAIGGSAPPVDLLPSGGASGSAPAPAPNRALALDAVSILRTFRDHPRDAGPWGEPAFAREVDLVRDQLEPIRSRRGLAASYRRDSAQRGAVRMAYALRWLELGDGVARPGWSELVTGRG